MQFKRKNLLLTLSTVLGLGLLTAADCGGDSNNGTTGTTGTTGVSKVDIKVEEWKEIKNGTKFAIGAANKVDLLAVSSDSSWLYASVGKTLFANNISADGDIVDDDKWGKIDLSATSLGGGAGKMGNIDTVITSIHRLSPTKGGVLISGNHSTAGDAVGALGLLAGKTFKAAWAPLSGASTHIGINGEATGLAMNGGVLRRGNDKEYVVGQYKLNANTAFNANQNRNFATADVADAGVAAASSDAYARAAAFTYASGDHHYAVIGAGAQTKSMIITEGEGVSIYADPSHPATNNNIANTDAAGKRWSVDTGTANTKINYVASDNKQYVYIAFAKTAVTNGGVAVFDAKTPANSPANVHKDWINKTVLDVAIDSAGQAWAVMEDKIVKIKTDGAPGDELKAATALPADGVKKADENKSFSKGVVLPTSNIAGAKFVKGALVIATTNAGLIVRLPEKTEKVTEKK